MMAPARPTLALRPFLPADAPHGRGDLPRQHRRADRRRLQPLAAGGLGRRPPTTRRRSPRRLAGRLTLIGTIDGSPAGFAALEEPGHIDMLYVHPAAARQGSARS